MTSDGPGAAVIEEHEPVAPQSSEASPARGLSSLSDLVGRGAWVGMLTGLVAGPVLPVAFLLVYGPLTGLVSSGLTEDAGGFGAGIVYTFVWLFSPLGLLVAFVGAVVGVLVGVITATTVGGALRLESRAGWHGGNAYLLGAGGLGGLLSLAVLVPIVALALPGAGSAIAYFWVVGPIIVLASAVLTWVQRTQLASLRHPAVAEAPPAEATAAEALTAAATPAEALTAAATPAGRWMTRALALRAAGFVAAGLVALVLAELAVLLPASGVASSCSSAAGVTATSEYTPWPPQVTCFGTDAVEFVPRGIYGVLALIALLAAVLILAGSTRLRTGPERIRSALAVVVSLGLVALTTVGALGPIATASPREPVSSFPADPADPYAPVDPYGAYDPYDEYQQADAYDPDDPVPAPNSSTTEPPALPPVEPPVAASPPSTTDTPDGLARSMQDLVDGTFAAAGPIVDPQIAPDIQTFPVFLDECTAGGLAGKTATLRVGFDTADVAQSLERVRTFWVAEGYQLFEDTENAKGESLDPAKSLNATGVDPQPASSLLMRIYDDYLLLDVASICVAA